MSRLFFDHDGGAQPPKKASASEERLLTFLRDRRSYPGQPRHIRMVQTHASWVVLTARYAYKLKRPVNFGFLDFSTLEKRLHYCQREVLLNRRLCPGIYLEVVPISMDEGRLSFGQVGRIVEYAVKMRRLPESRSMRRLVKRGQVTTREVAAIVATLTPFYAAAASTPEITAWGSIEKLKISTDENFRQTRDFIGGAITRPAFEAVRTFANSFYRDQAALFAARVREGRIRDCHGDLRLEHIHLGPPRLTIYDCIEFNDRLRYIDVANDVAFLAMDFDFHGRPDLARYFATHMVEALDDRVLPLLLDFYKCYRAYVRGKVETLRHNSAGILTWEQSQSRLDANRYFRLALQYAVCGSAPIALIVMGGVGSGKSTLAQALGRELAWEVFSSDRVRKELAGIPIHLRGAAKARYRLYSKRMATRSHIGAKSSTTNTVLQQREVGHVAEKGGMMGMEFTRNSSRTFRRRNPDVPPQAAPPSRQRQPFG